MFALMLALLLTSCHPAVQAGLVDAAPYELREEGKRLVAAIYTPLVRAAFAKLARSRGEDLSSPSMDEALSDQAVYAVFAWSSNDWEVAGGAPSFERVRVGLFPQGHPPVEAEVVNPLWVRHNLQVLTQFGAPTPFRDAVLVAAFPRESLRAGWRLAAYVKHQDGPLRIGRFATVRSAVITEDDLRKWR